VGPSAGVVLTSGHPTWTVTYEDLPLNGHKSSFPSRPVSLIFGVFWAPEGRFLGQWVQPLAGAGSVCQLVECLVPQLGPSFGWSTFRDHLVTKVQQVAIVLS
jgi:hypothetical protein